METKEVTFNYIILVPHRDAVNQFNEYRQKLFSEGVLGALSFPGASPLAEVSGPFSVKELKDLALNIRGLTAENDGKIQSCPSIAATRSSQMSFSGPELKLPISEGTFPEATKKKILRLLAPPLLCAAIGKPEEEPEFEAGPLLSFRAAALANLAIRALAGEPDYSFEWKISDPVWLPKKNGASR